MRLAFKEVAPEQGTRKEFCYFISDTAPASLAVEDVKKAAGIDGVEVASGSILRSLADSKTYMCNEDSSKFVEQRTGGGGGYPEPTGRVEITSNGIYNVKDYAEANINVAGTQLITDKGYPIVVLALYDEDVDEATCVRYVFNTAVNELVNRRTNVYDDEEDVRANVVDYNDDGSQKRVRFTKAYVNGTQYYLAQADEDYSDMFMKINGTLCAFVVPQGYFVPEFDCTNLPAIHRITFADGDVAVKEEIVPAGGVLTWE